MMEIFEELMIRYNYANKNDILLFPALVSLQIYLFPFLIAFSLNILPLCYRVVGWKQQNKELLLFFVPSIIWQVWTLYHVLTVQNQCSQWAEPKLFYILDTQCTWNKMGFLLSQYSSTTHTRSIFCRSCSDAESGHKLPYPGMDIY